MWKRRSSRSESLNPCNHQDGVSTSKGRRPDSRQKRGNRCFFYERSEQLMHCCLSCLDFVALTGEQTPEPCKCHGTDRLPAALSCDWLLIGLRGRQEALRIGEVLLLIASLMPATMRNIHTCCAHYYAGKFNLK